MSIISILHFTFDSRKKKGKEGVGCFMIHCGKRVLSKKRRRGGKKKRQFFFCLLSVVRGKGEAEVLYGFNVFGWGEEKRGRGRHGAYR